MPTYLFECDNCGARHETQMTIAQREKNMAGLRPEICAECGLAMRHVYTPVNIQGDLPGRGTDVSGYDETLGEYIKGRAHRRDVMKRKGFEEYAPDPKMKAYRDEAGYIRSHARRGDPEAKAAIDDQYKQAGKERRRKIIHESFKETHKSILS